MYFRRPRLHQGHYSAVCDQVSLEEPVCTTSQLGLVQERRGRLEETGKITAHDHVHHTSHNMELLVILERYCYVDSLSNRPYLSTCRKKEWNGRGPYHVEEEKRQIGRAHV